MIALKHTPLYETHIKYGGQMVPFVGWEMPLQYKGIIQEHMAVRKNVGIFDVSHMGEVRISGPDALPEVNRLTTNDANKLVDGQALYSTMLNEQGGIVDDLILYRENADNILIVVNAANAEKDFAWICSHLQGNAEAVDESPFWGEVALQGPRAAELLQPLVSFDLATLPFFTFRHGEIAAVPVIIARTGYTGEDGFEILIPANDAPTIWEALFAAGAEFPLVPCGLGCRDSLRLEARLSLHGNDIDETTTPLEAGLAWVVKMDKGDFIGKDALIKQKAEGLKRKLVGFELVEPGVPRAHYLVTDTQGREIGHVTSGMMAPLLRKPIGLAYVELAYAPVGSELWVIIREKKVKAKVVPTPFYKGTAGQVRATPKG
jgi:aminomethyltransferase